MTKTPERAVRELLDALLEGRSQAPGIGTAADVRWLDEQTGAWEIGRDGLGQRYGADREGVEDRRLEVRDLVGREVGDAAVVSATLIFGGVYGGEAFEVFCPSTFVLARVIDGWELVHHHTLAMRHADA